MFQNLHDKALASLLEGESEPTKPDPLHTVVTVDEICLEFWLNRKTVISHIKRGNFNARKAGGNYRGIWLIEWKSVDNYYQAKRKKARASRVLKK